MSGCLIAGTFESTIGSDPLPIQVAACLSAYYSGLPMLMVSSLGEVDWASLWAQYQAFASPGVIIYAGSLGECDAVGLTVADWARDWRLPLVLTLPIHPALSSQVMAFAALSLQAKATLAGVFLGQGTADSPELAAFIPRIPSLINAPILGRLPRLQGLSPTELAATAGGWELDRLNLKDP